MSNRVLHSFLSLVPLSRSLLCHHSANQCHIHTIQSNPVSTSHLHSADICHQLPSLHMVNHPLSPCLQTIATLFDQLYRPTVFYFSLSMHLFIPNSIYPFGCILPISHGCTFTFLLSALNSHTPGLCLI